MQTLHKLLYFTWFIFYLLLPISVAEARLLSIDELRDLGLSSLMDITVETASGTEETLIDAPATMAIVTKKDIQQRGYSNIVEILEDLPGFDVTTVNGMVYSSSHQRGYRTPFTTRTLLMVNGIVDNTLWAHDAMLSRQYPISNVERVEVLYGPASAVYGPNAFLGVVNIITDDGSKLDVGEITGSISGQIGSFNSKSVDATLKGKLAEDLSFSISTQQFNSDEPDFSDRYGYLSNSLYGSEQLWGVINDIQHEGEYLDHYYDPSKDYGVLADLSYKGLKLGIIHWKVKEGYGPYFAADRAQNNGFWSKDSNQYYAKYKTDLTEHLKSQSLMLYRENRRYGYWAEAEPDGQDASFISYTQWNAVSSSWLFEQAFEYEFNPDLLLSAGLKYQRKELTKSYDIPGYWPSAISSTAEIGSGIGHSTDLTYDIPPYPGDMPDYNLTNIRDVGGYVQAILDQGDWRFNLGLRYDHNSMYGSVINPRVAAIYNYDNDWTFKALYGEASQEPAPILLWGGWSDRAVNPDLQPEKVQNAELIAMYHTNSLWQEWSLYKAHYSNVIKEEAENAGTRDIWGLEYRAKLAFAHFIEGFNDITTYFNYTYTYPESSLFYDHDADVWLEGDAALGDIAPHKINLGINMPLGDWNLNLRGNYVSSRELYLRNPLRGQSEKLGSYFVLNSAISYQYEPLTVTFKVSNLLDKNYFHPGAESANAGNDFSQRSLGYMNSIVPQAERSYWLQVKFEF
ncbi:TonB-dependent receptor [Candidatus Albibeggiatoa sp. nov. BB20]|uniref:TonB-dependent receptor plug domain-containing protein n=1 Tax=Candidatus Albibeggiatoa sp. nov. BB20 TaxID=3162723 RepID=UPI0033658424